MTEVTLADYTAAFEAAFAANLTVLDEDAGTGMGWVMWTDPISGKDMLWTQVGRSLPTAEWTDQDWQVTVTLADQTEDSDATSSWTCRVTRSGLTDEAAWTTESTLFASAGATTVEKATDGILTEQGDWSDTLQWGNSVWQEEIDAAWAQEMADAAAAAAEAAAAEAAAAADEAGDEATGDEAAGDEDAGDEGTDDTGDEGTDDTGDEGAADEVVEAEPSLKEQYLAAQEGQESWGWEGDEEGNWLLWCGGWRDATGVDGDFDLTEGATVGVTVTWTDIVDGKKNTRVAAAPVTSTAEITLARADLPSLEPPVVEETDDGTEGEEGDSATFIKATSVALGAFAVMLA